MPTVLRQEVKFLISHADSIALQEELGMLLDADCYSKGGYYTVRSLYFDSINAIDFMQKLNGEEIRKKLRIRIYDVMQDNAKFEMKEKVGAYQKKTSIPIPKCDTQKYIAGDFSPLLNYGKEAAVRFYTVLSMGAYRPASVIEYRRRAYVHPLFSTRITFDTDIRRCDTFYDLYSQEMPLQPVLADAVVLEVKYNEKLLDSVRKVLAKYHLTNISYGKYTSGRKINWLP